MEVYGIIYKIRNKINNKIYIGQTINDFDIRYSGGNIYNTQNTYLKRSIDKYGIENFEVDKNFDVAYSKEELDKLEDMYIKIYDTTNREYGYNRKYGGANGRLTEETKRKLSEARKGKYVGENSPLYGKEKSESVRNKISKTLTGKYCGEKHPLYGKHRSEETKEKLRIAHTGLQSGEKHPLYGKHHSEETKNKISEANKGKTAGEKNGNYKGFAIIYKDGTVLKNLTRREIEDMGISQSIIYKLTSSKKPYELSPHTQTNREFLKTLVGIRILKMEDYIKEFDTTS